MCKSQYPPNGKVLKKNKLHAIHQIVIFLVESIIHHLDNWSLGGKRRCRVPCLRTRFSDNHGQHSNNIYLQEANGFVYWRWCHHGLSDPGSCSTHSQCVVFLGKKLSYSAPIHQVYRWDPSMPLKLCYS